MFIISVIPIGRKVGSETLSYYIQKGPTLGSVLLCPLKKGFIKGLVVDVRDIREAKHEIRSADFTIKKIEDSSIPRNVYTDSYLQALSSTASYYTVPLYSLLTELTPKLLLESEYELLEKTKPQSSHFEKKYIEDTIENRVCIIEDIASTTQGITHIIVPTSSDVTKLHKLFSTEIPLLSFSGDYTLKKNTEALNKIQDMTHGLVISTPQYLAVTQNRVQTIVIEQYSDSVYINHRLQGLDIRHFIEEYTQKSDIELILSDILLLENNAAHTNLTTKPDTRLIDMSEQKDKNFFWKSAELSDLLLKAKESRANSFLYVNRLGKFTMTICSDCKELVSCDCGGVLVIHSEKNGTKYYKCHRCGKKTSLSTGKEVRCKKCNSWKLEPQGTGIQTVADDLKNLGFTVFEVHSDITKTPKQILKTIEEFAKTPGSILVGTELALRYLESSVPVVVVVSMDSMLSVPDHSTDFTALYTLRRLQVLAKNYFLIQSRMPRTPIFSVILESAIHTFKTSYIKDLRQLEYPPFGVFITIESKYEPKKKDSELLKELFNTHSLEWSFYQGVWYTEQKISKEKWIQDDLLRYKLSSLPNYYTISVI